MKKAIFIGFAILLLLPLTIAEENLNATKDLSIEYYAGNPLYLFQDYEKLFKVKNNDHITGEKDDIDVMLYYSIYYNDSLLTQNTTLIEHLNYYTTTNTGFFRPENLGSLEICGVIFNASVLDPNSENDKACAVVDVIDTRSITCNISLAIKFNGTIFNSGDSLNFTPSVDFEKYPYLIEYWIEDLFGNYAKNKYNTSNSDKKSWKASVGDKVDVFQLKARIADVLCNDSNTEDNYAEKTFFVKGFFSKDSIISIDKANTGKDNKVKFGEQFDVDISVYKGDTDKSAIYVWLSDGSDAISRKTKINFDEKFKAYRFSVPVASDNNCDSKLIAKEYALHVSGLDVEMEDHIFIEGVTAGNCAVNHISSEITEKNKTSTGLFFEAFGLPEYIFPGKEIETKYRIVNRDSQRHSVEVYSYLYRSSKCYSGEREENIKSIEIEGNSNAEFFLTNVIDLPPDTEIADMKFKVRYRYDDMKTYKELTSDVNIRNEIIENVSDNASLEPINAFTANESIPMLMDGAKYSSAESVNLNLAFAKNEIGAVAGDAVNQISISSQEVYSSNTEKVRKLVPYMIAIVTSLLSVFIISKNKFKI